jgi:hypothetical protein
MIDFLLENFLSKQFYYYFDISSVGSLYNLNHKMRNCIINELNNDNRIMCKSCMCNICDGCNIDCVIEMYAFYNGKNIILTCPWYFEILQGKSK